MVDLARAFQVSFAARKGSDYYSYHYNHKGDVVSVTDANKTEVAYYEYDAWGNIMTEAGTWWSPYCFGTKERDYEGKSGLIYFGGRYYSPEIGRWTRRDPAGTVDGLNLYAYCSASPANLTDPWGLYVIIFYPGMWDRDPAPSVQRGPRRKPPRPKPPVPGGGNSEPTTSISCKAGEKWKQAKTREDCMRLWTGCRRQAGWRQEGRLAGAYHEYWDMIECAEVFATTQVCPP